MLNKVALLIIAIVFSSVAQAQNPPEVSRVPLQEMAKLKLLSGKWNMVVEASFDEGKTWQTTPPATVTLDYRHKNMMLAEIPDDLSTPGFHMESYITYDQYRKVFRKAAVDDVWGIMDLYEGKFNGEELVMTNLKSGTLFPVGEGKWRAFRLTIELASPKRLITIEKSDDNGKSWQPAFKAHYEKIG